MKRNGTIYSNVIQFFELVPFDFFNPFQSLDTVWTDWKYLRPIKNSDTLFQSAVSDQVSELRMNTRDKIY